MSAPNSPLLSSPEPEPPVHALMNRRRQEELGQGDGASPDHDEDDSKTHSAPLPFWRQRVRHLLRPKPSEGEKNANKEEIRNLVGFWLCGLMNNFVFAVMLSAGLDLMNDGPSQLEAGFVLLFSIVPCLIVKLLGPLFVDSLPYRDRVMMVAAASIASFFIVALGKGIAIKLAGVAVGSLGAGLGEITFLALTSYYQRPTITAWSSGTGAAGLSGASAYMVCTTVWGISPVNTLLLFSLCPMVMVIGFSIMTEGVDPSKKNLKPDDIPTDESDLPDIFIPTDGSKGTGAAAIQWNMAKVGMKQKLRLIPSLFHYMAPLFVVYVSEYLANQGVLPTIWFSDGPLKSRRDHYVYYQTAYQAGVFISRSSATWIQVRKLKLLSALQFLNLTLYLVHATGTDLFPNFYVLWLTVLWEGLVGGAMYVNSFAKISEEVRPSFREFALGIVSVADTAGIVLASLLAIRTERWLLNLESPADFSEDTPVE